MRPERKRHGGSLVGLILSVVLALPTHAHAEDVSDHDHDRARRALEAGEILPLKTVLERVRLDTPGEVMEVEMERKNARWVYEVKVLRPGGALVKLVLDASDGTIVARGGRDARQDH
jgi:uncharacterized membrane protein YkoI